MEYLVPVEAPCSKRASSREVVDGLVSRDDGWRIPDWLWERNEPLLPAPPGPSAGPSPPAGHNRTAMNGILLALRTGMQWKALNSTGICSSSPAHRRFQEWAQAGVFEESWRQGLLRYEELKGIDWGFLALDGAMGNRWAARTPAPILGEADRADRRRGPDRAASSGDRLQGLCLDAGYDIATFSPAGRRARLRPSRALVGRGARAKRREPE